jgi:hypothetical protein
VADMFPHPSTANTVRSGFTVFVYLGAMLMSEQAGWIENDGRTTTFTFQTLKKFSKLKKN